MQLPFTKEQFFDVFRAYNEAVWPAQWLLVALAVGVVVLALRARPLATRLASAALAIMWFWMAIAYHVAFFARINRVAVVFGVAFLIQGGLFAWLVFRPDGIRFRPSTRGAAIVGWLLIAYALVAYPLLAYTFDQRYPSSPTFGVPCPTTIFTLGVLVWARGALSWRFALVPLLWSVVGTSAALNLGVTEDFGLLAAALLTLTTFVNEQSVPVSLESPSLTAR